MLETITRPNDPPRPLDRDGAVHRLAVSVGQTTVAGAKWAKARIARAGGKHLASQEELERFRQAKQSAPAK